MHGGVYIYIYMNIRRRSLGLGRQPVGIRTHNCGGLMDWIYLLLLSLWGEVQY